MTDPDPQLVDLADQLKTADADTAPDLREQMFARYLELVRGGTTTDGLPYPDPDDPWFEGADAIRALAEALGGRVVEVLKSGSVNAASAATAYPVGISVMYLTLDQANAGGWPGNTWLYVVTFRASTTTNTTQMIYRASYTSGGHLPAYFRAGSSDGWSAWAGLSSPFGVAAGSAKAGPTAGNATKTVTVTLPVDKFTIGPVVTATVSSSVPGQRGVGVTTITKSSFILVFANTAASATTTDTAIGWHAVQMNSASNVSAQIGDTDDAVVTCPTEGCENQGVEIAVPTHWTDDDGASHPVDEIECGVCGTVLTPVTLEE